MAEAYVPLPDGRSIPVHHEPVLVSGGGDVFNISVNVAEGGVTSSAGQGKDLGRADFKRGAPGAAQPKAGRWSAGPASAVMH
jgi:hypothetical protein